MNQPVSQSNPRRAARMALCKRLRETGMQRDDTCDGDMVRCGCCDRTLDAIEEAVFSERSRPK